MRTKNSALAIRSDSLWERYKRLAPGRRLLITVFAIWFIQAVPKWTAAVTADGEMSAQIMKVFITPRYETRLASTAVNPQLVSSTQSQ